MPGPAIYKVAYQQLTLEDGVALAVHLPHGSKEHLFRLEDSGGVEFRLSTQEDGVDAAMPFTSPESPTLAGPVDRQTLYFYQESGSDQVLHWSYLYVQ